MSGGSWNYAYETVERFAEALIAHQRLDGRPASEPPSPARLRFATHLRKVAEAMKAIEWVDSYDSSPPEDEDAIARVIGKNRVKDGRVV